MGGWGWGRVRIRIRVRVRVRVQVRGRCQGRASVSQVGPHVPGSMSPLGDARAVWLV